MNETRQSEGRKKRRHVTLKTTRALKATRALYDSFRPLLVDIDKSVLTKCLVLFASLDFRVFSASGHYLSTEFLWCQLDAAALEIQDNSLKSNTIKALFN
jgi:hypothetical protein